MVQLRKNIRLKNDLARSESVSFKKRTLRKKTEELFPSFLVALLLSSSFMSSAQGMVNDFEPEWRDHNWSHLFYKPYGACSPLGPKVLKYLDERSLGRAAQVNHGWRQSVDQTRSLRLDFEKQHLYALILEVTGAEPNEVQRAQDQLEHYLKAKVEKKSQNPQQGSDLWVKLAALKPRLLQPESLVRANDTLLNNLLSANELSETHPALKPIVALIKDLEAILSLNTLGPSLEKVLTSLKNHYDAYLKSLLGPICDRALHLHPKALLSGEGFLGNLQGFTSYRISQDMARSLLSKDQHGLLAKTNTQGSHAVCFKRSEYNSAQGVHFKGNTTNTGLPVGRESAVYALSQILFPRNKNQGRMSSSSLLSLNEVEIKTPLEGTEVNRAFREALRDGKTSDEFFTHFPLYEKEFTQKSPNHVLQAGLHVEGVLLEDFIEGVNAGKYVYDQIDLSSFSEHIFLSMLTNPTDGTPGNFMLRRFTKNTFSIVGIDNDMALEVGDTFAEKVIPPFVPGQKMKPETKHSVRVKNILYCLPLMNQPLFSSTFKRILSLNPELIALQWLERLKEQNARYDDLQNGSYVTSSVTQARETYISPTQVQDLHLPFLLDPDFIPQMCQAIRQAQAYLTDHKATSHWQFLLKICPLSGRFYQELVNQVKGSVIGAYLKIDPPKSDPGKPRKEVTYLEDVLNLKEKLSNDQTVEETLKLVTARSDGTMKFTQNLSEAAGEILATTDLFKQPFLLPFLRFAFEGFGYLIQGKISISSAASSLSSIVSPTSKLEASWSKDDLLHKAISEKVSIAYLKKLLDLGLDVTVMDKERRTILRYAVEQGADISFFSLLKSFCPIGQLTSWVNTIASDRLTALDVALEQSQISAFQMLISYGAIHCHPNLALKFYKNIIHSTKDESLKQSFLKLMNINDELRWHVCLEEMFPAYQNKKDKKDKKDKKEKPIFTAKSSKRFLPNIIKDQILNQKNQWKSYTQEGNHMVCRATYTNKTLNSEHSLYFKVYPELPGVEEAVGLLTRKLLGYGAPHTELTNIGGCPVLLSHSHGDKEKTLDFILRKSPQLLKDLDEESLSGVILVAMLINPEDGKPSNYVIEPHPTKPNKYRIVGVDNDHAFVPALVAEKPKTELLSKKLIPVAQVKTILYCLDQMKNPIHPNIRNLFINLRPDEVLDEWLRELKKVNVSYNDLFPNAGDHGKFFKDHHCFLGIPFQKGAISHLYNKFVTLREILTKNPQIPHMELLSKLEPRLAKRYQLVTSLPTVKGRWDSVDAPFYETTKSGSGTTLTHSGDILRSMDIPLKESVLESIRNGKGLGPLQALEELNTSKEVVHIKTLEALGARAGDLNILKTLQLASTRAKFLKDLDFKGLNNQEQEAVLSYLKNKQLRELTLKNCSLLKDNWLVQNLDLSSLVKLDLRGCEGITYRSLVHLSKTALNLEELNLSYITTLKEIGDIGALTDALLIFKKLKILNLRGCIKLKKLLIQAPKLHYLNIENCVRLKDQILDKVIEGSKELQTLRVKGADKILGGPFREEHPTFIVTDTKLSVIEQYNLGIKYAHGQGVSQDNVEAFKWYLKAAVRGDREAQNNLGVMYENGRGVSKDDREAVKWYLSAAVLGDSNAQFNLGWMYANGYGVLKDDGEAVKWYQKAADQGNEDAQNNLGRGYANGCGVPRDDGEAVKWYRKAADQGNANAQHNLGSMYANGHGVPKDDGEAVKWYRKAADQGNAAAQNNLGLMYENGQGVSKDDEEAVKWYQKAADQGDANAQHNLGLLYENGQGIPKDDGEAVKWYRKAADQGDANAQHNLGWLYEKGQGVPKNNGEALKWYRKAADQGHSQAQVKLGVVYENGQGIPKDYDEAVKWYWKAADQGYDTAQYYLGLAYANGQSLPKDEGEAVKWYRKAADQGHSQAQVKLGEMYANGRGVPKDDGEAVKWFRQAADQGYADAQVNLGCMYINGQGVPKDDEEAVKWFQKAANQNEPFAFYKLAYLRNKGVKLANFQETSHSLYQKAFNLFTKTEEHKRSYAENSLGVMYQCGRGVGKDFRKAFEWYQKAADQNDGYGQANLGRIYKEGLGVEQNLNLALLWIKKSVEQNCAHGFYNLALLYRDGEGVERNDMKASSFLIKAIEHKHGEAFYALGWMFEQGRGVEVGFAKAQTFYGAGKERYAEDAFYSIGRIYEYGLGGESVNLFEAKRWYQKAADVHFEPSFDKLKKLEGI